MIMFTSLKSIKDAETNKYDEISLIFCISYFWLNFDSLAESRKHYGTVLKYIIFILFTLIYLRFIFTEVFSLNIG